MIKLTGEAFFDVVRDTARPFIIEAGDAVVEVLGTSFNVRTREDGDRVEVTVATGIVSLASKLDDANQIILQAGNSGIYHKAQNRLELVERANPNDIAWKTREIRFAATPLKEAIAVINKVYQVNIALEDPALMGDCPITVSFQDQDFAAVLNVIVQTMDLEMKRTDGVIILSGPGC